MDQKKNELMSYYRQCGGERHHSVIAEETRTTWGDVWPADEGNSVYGDDTWSIVECAGCRTVTFIHSHSFSEDVEYADDGPMPIVHRHLYPPTPPRKMPEWRGDDLLIGLNGENQWIVKLHADIYAAMGLEAYALAAMGTRAIVDFVVTSKAGEEGNFKDKLKRLRQHGVTEIQAEVIYAAFDAGSAAAHRGYCPTREDVCTLLDITESLLQQIYIDPVRRERQADAAASLKSRTPERAKPQKVS